MLRRIRDFVRFSRDSQKRILKKQVEISQQLAEVSAEIQLTSLLNQSGYIPFNRASLNFSSLALILNDILINNRKNIIEFGSGTSTILIARLLQKNRIEDGRIITVEHDRDWITVLKRILSEEGLLNLVEIFYAPLIDCKGVLDDNKWYDTEILKKHLHVNKIQIDTCIVDGPPAWYENVKKSRYPALPFVFEFLNDNSILFLDDANREGEKEILERWESFQLRRVDFSHYLSALIKGTFYDISLP